MTPGKFDMMIFYEEMRILVGLGCSASGVRRSSDPVPLDAHPKSQEVEKVPRVALGTSRTSVAFASCPCMATQSTSIYATASLGRTVDVSDDIACTHVIRLMWDYLDAEVTPATAEVIRRHLEICSRCRGLCEFHESFLRAVRRLVHGCSHPSSEKQH
jgi:hypothetical protein